MAYPLGHVGVGAAATVALLLVTGTYRSPAAPFVAILGGAWAITPDLHLVFDSLDPLHSSALADLFFFHRLIDVVIDPTDTWTFAGFALVLMVFAFGALAAAQYAACSDPDTTTKQNADAVVGSSGGERRNRTSR